MYNKPGSGTFIH